MNYWLTHTEQKGFLNLTKSITYLWEMWKKYSTSFISIASTAWPHLAASSDVVSIGCRFLHMFEKHCEVIILVIAQFFAQFSTDSTSVNKANFKKWFAIVSEVVILLVQGERWFKYIGKIPSDIFSYNTKITFFFLISIKLYNICIFRKFHNSEYGLDIPSFSQFLRLSLVG